MLVEEILNLIRSFESETWKYDENDKLYNDMQYVYSIEKKIKGTDEANLKPIYDKLVAIIGIIRFKYGFESMVIRSNPELEQLKTIIEGVPLSSDDIINQYNYISTVFNNYIKGIKKVDFISNNYGNIQGKEGLYLAVESLKSLIENENYRHLLGENQIIEILLDCIKLNNGSVSLENLESKYKEIIKQIWERSLSNGVLENGNFRLLFSNISGGSLKSQSNNLIDRQFQSSCSLISSSFVATYGDPTRKIGFIYPKNSDIVMASAYDLGSNVFGKGSVNKEKGTILVTPEALEKIGKKRTSEKSEDIYSSSCYNEVLVNAEPCGIAVLGLGEKDLNIDYEEAQVLATEMNLPISDIDTMQYKNDLSISDKDYIAFHALMSYLGKSREELMQEIERNNGSAEIYNLIPIYRDQLAEIFLTLKKEGTLSKGNMCQAMNGIVDLSRMNS